MKSAGTIPVSGPDGLRGTIDASINLQKAERVLITLENGHRLWVPANMLLPTGDRGYYLSIAPGQIEASLDGTDTQQTVLVVPVIAEEVAVSREKHETGSVQIKKEVHVREERIDEPGFREHVDIKRVPINQILDAPVEVRYEGDTMIIPVMEEVVVVEKRIILKEEIRVTRQREEIHDPKSVKLKKEEVKIERKGSAGKTKKDNGR